MKKLLALMAMPLLMGMTGCFSNGPVIGILQPVEHSALGAARDGFVAGLKEGGYSNATIKYRNAGGQDASLNSMAKDLIGQCSLTLGIGTGAALSLKGASDNAGVTKPLLFTAVTDPVQAGLVQSKDNPSGYICGTTDANPVEEQIALIKEFKPTASKVGIIYTQTEVNSKVQSDQAEAAIKATGMTTKVSTVTGPGDIKATALALADSGVDAIYVPTDNNIAANMNAIKEAVANRKILVVCGEENMLKAGGHVTLSIDYYALGYSTGLMAAEILKGNKKPTDYKVVPVASSECSYVYSSSNLAAAGLEMSSAILSAHDWKNVDEQ